MTIAPGLIATPMLLTMPQEIQDSLAASVPFPARFGEASEYADLALHIIGNVMLNGDVIRLDGALRLRRSKLQRPDLTPWPQRSCSGAIASMWWASSTSRSDRPSTSWVARITSTRL